MAFGGVSTVTDPGQAFRFATVSPEGTQWLLRRNCSLTPRQMASVFGLLSAVSLGIAGFFWSLGAWMVVPFALLEVLAVGLAFVLYARHAVDRERICLQDDCLVVELESAGRTERAEFRRAWVRVEPRADDGSLIEVFGGGRSVTVGRFVRADMRPALAREIRMAVRGA